MSFLGSKTSRKQIKAKKDKKRREKNLWDKRGKIAGERLGHEEANNVKKWSLNVVVGVWEGLRDGVFSVVIE